MAAMPYRLHTSRPAQDELARLWTQADSATRSAITQASHRADQLLRSSAAPTAGVPCPRPGLPTTRCLDISPLVVEFVFMPSFGEIHIRGYYLAPWRP
jgi:hypothetical protein